MYGMQCAGGGLGSRIIRRTTLQGFGDWVGLFLLVELSLERDGLARWVVGEEGGGGCVTVLPAEWGAAVAFG